MKKLALLTVAILLAGFTSANAQNNEISISYGYPSYRPLNDAFITVVSFAGVISEMHYYGSAHLEYYHHTSKRLAFGVLSAYEYGEGKIRSAYNKEMDIPANCNFGTLMASMKTTWLYNDRWGIYSKFALGCTYRTDKSKDVDTEGNEIVKKAAHFLPAFAITPFGAEYGDDFVRGFFEISTGSIGMAIAGVRFRF